MWQFPWTKRLPRTAFLERFHNTVSSTIFLKNKLKFNFIGEIDVFLTINN